MDDELTPENFIGKIKAMGERERLKVPLKKLIEIICQVVDAPAVSTQLDELRESIHHINRMATKNNTEISSLKIQNEEYLEKNIALKAEVELLKLHAQECKANQHPPPAPPVRNNANDAEIRRLQEQITEMQDEMNSIQQYLRVNNLEIVGLPDTNEGETEETLLINALNDLEGLEEPVRPEDIDISHPLNSKRKDEKPVHVVRFVSRKTKFMILAAKKRETNKQFKLRNKYVYINEHLSKSNRALFAAAQERKRALDFKFCWTRGGNIYLRKTENSPIITISCNDDLNNLI
jgi:hypothetical protein